MKRRVPKPERGPPRGKHCPAVLLTNFHVLDPGAFFQLWPCLCPAGRGLLRHRGGQRLAMGKRATSAPPPSDRAGKQPKLSAPAPADGSGRGERRGVKILPQYISRFGQGKVWEMRSEPCTIYGQIDLVQSGNMVTVYGTKYHRLMFTADLVRCSVGEDVACFVVPLARISRTVPHRNLLFLRPRTWCQNGRLCFLCDSRCGLRKPQMQTMPLDPNRCSKVMVADCEKSFPQHRCLKSEFEALARKKGRSYLFAWEFENVNKVVPPRLVPAYMPWQVFRYYNWSDTLELPGQTALHFSSSSCGSGSTGATASDTPDPAAAPNPTGIAIERAQEDRVGNTSPNDAAW